SDRFGDNGIVGTAIVRAQDGVACIDSFLLSCRVIGRQAETALLTFLADWARSRGLDALEGDFIQTAKNAPAADFYTRHGFEYLIGEGALSRWRAPLDDLRFQWPSVIQLADTAHRRNVD